MTLPKHSLKTSFDRSQNQRTWSRLERLFHVVQHHLENALQVVAQLVAKDRKSAVQIWEEAGVSTAGTHEITPGTQSPWRSSPDFEATRRGEELVPYSHKAQEHAREGGPAQFKRPPCRSHKAHSCAKLASAFNAWGEREAGNTLDQGCPPNTHSVAPGQTWPLHSKQSTYRRRQPGR